jgi:hypothetical protein
MEADTEVPLPKTYPESIIQNGKINNDILTNNNNVT